MTNIQQTYAKLLGVVLVDLNAEFGSDGKALNEVLGLGSTERRAR